MGMPHGGGKAAWTEFEPEPEARNFCLRGDLVTPRCIPQDDLAFCLLIYFRHRFSSGELRHINLQWLRLLGMLFLLSSQHYHRY